MPRYHLKLKNLEGRTIADDEDGADFESVEQAFMAAFEGARELWGLFLLDRVDPRRHVYELTDAAGEVMFTLPFTEILDSCRSVRVHSREPTQSPAHGHLSSLPALREMAQKLGEQVASSRSIIARSRDLRHRSKQLASEIRLITRRSSVWV